MTDEMQLLRDARPNVRGPLRELTEERRRELVAQLTPATRRRRLGPRRAFALAGATVASVVLAVVMVSTGGGGGEAWAAGVVKVAEASPRLLIDAPQWKVTRADEFSLDVGEMTFSDGTREVELRWQPVRDYQSTVMDRKHSSDLQATATVMGTEARIYRYEGTNDFTAVWVAGDHAVELRGVTRDLAAFEEILGSLRTVGVDAWLSAMPAGVVNPSSRPQVVRSMLADIPVPPAFDRAQLERGTAVRDRYQLGAEVSGAVACAWIGRWVAATEAGDASGIRQAVGAMATSHEWSVLHDMNGQGDYPEVLWGYADAIAAGGTVTGGKSLSVQDSYAGALGCPSP